MCWLSSLERFLCWFRIGAWLLNVVLEVNSQCGGLAVCAVASLRVSVIGGQTVRFGNCTSLIRSGAPFGSCLDGVSVLV